MGITKSNLFTEKQNEMALAAKAFSHPARLAILEFLLKSNSCINGDLVNELGLAQATISQHLRELKDIGIIQGNIEGNRVCYCIDAQRWQEIKENFNRIFNEFQPPEIEDCC
ncbi:ArsR/SmtB family transcription factor [Salegentibacter sp. HM20]